MGKASRRKAERRAAGDLAPVRRGGTPPPPRKNPGGGGAFGTAAAGAPSGSREDHLRSIARASERLARADAALLEAIGQARTAGVPWEKIGAAAAMTGEGARKRFARSEAACGGAAG